MEKNILGCRGCGHIERADTEVAGGAVCPECGSRLEEMKVANARTLAAARRRADRRRLEERATREVGIGGP